MAAEAGAAQVLRVSRSGREGAVTYEQAAERHGDAACIINTTPCGMYPAVEDCPLELDAFPGLRGVVDAVYNPLRTNLVLEARRRGIPAEGGLYMLAAQAAYASALFQGTEATGAQIDLAYQTVLRQMENIVLIGMPGSGKSTVAARLAEALDRVALDSDAEIEERNGASCASLIERNGEAAFRALESEVIADLGRRSGMVIATGGGCVTREENYASLHQNGVIFWLRRDLDKLPREGRPLSAGDLAAMYDKRRACYERFADHSINNNGTVEETLRQIMAALPEGE